VAFAGVHTDSQEPGEQPSIIGDDAQVRCHHQIQSGPHHRAAHRSHGRHGEGTDPYEGVIDLRDGAKRVVIGWINAGEQSSVRSAAELTFRPDEDRAADRKIRVDFVTDGDQLARHGHCERVSTLRSIEHYDGGTSVTLNDDFAHPNLPSSIRLVDL
jgi:hypothetical protein